MESFIINHWAVWICAILNLVLGALWYSPALFFNSWKKENGLTDEQLKNMKPMKVYGLAFILGLIFSYNMAFYLGDDKTDMAWGTTAGLLTGLGFCFTLFTIIALFELRSWKYILINAGYIILYSTLVGLILGAWR